jgi:hypothetical protein
MCCVDRLKSHGGFAIRHAGQGRRDGGRDAAGGAVGAADHCEFLLLRLAAAATFLIAFLCAFRSAFQNTRLNSFKCFHHWGAGVRLPFFTFAILSLLPMIYVGSLAESLLGAESATRALGNPGKKIDG